MKKQKTQRQLQASQQIKKILAQYLIREGLATISQSLITILEADISPDFKNCRIYVDITKGKISKEEILGKLNLMAGSFKNELSKKLAIRILPNITFILDETSQNAIDIEKLLNQESFKFKD